MLVLFIIILTSYTRTTSKIYCLPIFAFCTVFYRFIIIRHIPWTLFMLKTCNLSIFINFILNSSQSIIRRCFNILGLFQTCYVGECCWFVAFMSFYIKEMAIVALSCLKVDCLSLFATHTFLLFLIIERLI